MFALWRFDSIKVAISSVRQKRPGSKPGLYSLIAHYTVLLALFPYKVYIPAIFMSGLVSALIVTPSIRRNVFRISIGLGHRTISIDTECCDH